MQLKLPQTVQKSWQKCNSNQKESSFNIKIKEIKKIMFKKNIYVFCKSFLLTYSTQRLGSVG